MAWFWNSNKKQKEEILSVKKTTELPIYEVIFNNPCKHCGRKEVRTFNLRMSKDPMESKAIGNYINEQYDNVLNQSYKLIESMGVKRASTKSFALLNKNTLDLEFVSADTILDLVVKRNK